MEQEYMKLVRLGNNVVNMIDLKSAERKDFMSKILEDVNVYLVYYKKINSERVKIYINDSKLLFIYGISPST